MFLTYLHISNLEMALPSSSKSKLTMTLIIHTKKEKVLFAETSKPVVDILLHMSTLPLATVVKLQKFVDIFKQKYSIHDGII